MESSAQDADALDFEAVVRLEPVETGGAVVAHPNLEPAAHRFEEQRELRHVRGAISRLHVHGEPGAGGADFDPVAAGRLVRQREPQTADAVGLRINRPDVSYSSCHKSPPAQNSGINHDLTNGLIRKFLTPRVGTE